MEDILHDAKFWQTISFIIFLIVAVRFGKSAVLGALDAKIATIREEIERAENLRVEAQELLAQYQRKQRDAAREAEEIVETARTHAEAIRKNAEKDIEEMIAHREAHLKERLARMEQTAIADMKSHAAHLALQATREIVAVKLDKGANDTLVSQTLEELPADFKAG